MKISTPGWKYQSETLQRVIIAQQPLTGFNSFLISVSEVFCFFLHIKCSALVCLQYKYINVQKNTLAGLGINIHW